MERKNVPCCEPKTRWIEPVAAAAHAVVAYHAAVGWRKFGAISPSVKVSGGAIVKKLILLILGTLLSLATAHVTEAQRSGKVYRIGYLQTASGQQQLHLVKAFKEGMQGLGYVEGRNVTIEYRFAEGKSERLADLAAELIRLKVDLIVSGGTSATRAAQKATGTIPIVMGNSGDDPVADGFVASLARPGGNITGLTSIATELSGKRLELLKEAIPKASRVAVLLNPGNPRTDPSLKEIEATARALGITLHSLAVRSPSDFDSAFGAALKGRADALIVIQDALFNSYRKLIVDLAAKNRLAAMYDRSDFVEAGGLMSYGTNVPDLYRRAAIYVDKILKGAKPADLPVEQPTKFELIINLKMAKQIGLTISQSMLYRADVVIR